MNALKFLSGSLPLMNIDRITFILALLYLRVLQTVAINYIHNIPNPDI